MAPPVDLALKGHGDHARQDNPGPVSEEFDLRAGDTLYVPRGLVHEAISTDERSLHVTVGILSWTWFDFLLEAVEKLASSDLHVRAALPSAFARSITTAALQQGVRRVRRPPRNERRCRRNP